MLLLGHLIATLLCLSRVAAATWIMYVYADDQCKDDYFPTLSNTPNAWGETGDWSTCIQQGGNSWGVSTNGGCQFRSWSGDDCRGSSTDPYTSVACQSFPFGSISVEC
jgi:hypothetical protein